MSYWIKLIALSLGLAFVSLAGWAMFLPAAHPLLERAGLLGPMRAIGLPIAETSAGAGRGGPPFGGGGGEVQVIAAEVSTASSGSRLMAIGTARAERSVTVTSEVAGILKSVAVRSGDWVEAGALIAELTDEAQQLAVARAQLALQDAQSRADRVAQLRSSGSATQVQIDEAELALNRAALDLRDAEFELRRRQITAPISGWLGLTDLEPGNQITTATELARLDDRSTLLMDFQVPERLIGLISVGDALQASPLARPADALAGRIRAIDARVDQDNRSLRVQGEIANDDDRLRPGMAFRVTVDLPGETLPLVDPLAIQWDRNGAFVWALDDAQRATRTPIEIVQRRDDSVLVRADLDAGAVIVVEGVQNLRPGAQVAPREIRPAPSGDAPDELTLKASDSAEHTDTTPDI
ncbi:MAG: efflux RND transporter periplasmic adaptor subunit [Roseinatronobacter sp.]